MIVVTLDIRCDWCGQAIAGTGCGIEHSRIAIDDAWDAAVMLEARLSERGAPIPSPPGQQHHLCRTCIGRGTPPRSNHAVFEQAKRERAEKRRKARADA